jgi:TonB family protein
VCKLAIVVGIASSLLLIPSGHSQTSQYPNNAEGLRQFLLGCIADAHGGDEAALNRAVESTEIPDYAAWFPRNYPGPGNSWVDPYGRELEARQHEMTLIFHALARDHGEFTTRQLVDVPGMDHGMEWGMLHAAAQPVDIYFASWQSDGDSTHTSAPIGYFFFIDGGFRWDSTIQFMWHVDDAGNYVKNEPFNVSKLVFVHKVDPIYPYPADGKHPTGIVRLRFTVNADGSVRDVESVGGEGTTSDPRLIKAAIHAIQQWRYQHVALDGRPQEVHLLRVDVKVEPAAGSNQ